MECNGCSQTTLTLADILNKPDKLLQFCVAHKLLKDTTVCRTCKQSLTIVKNYTFICRKTTVIKKKKVTCNFKRSALKNTWFSKSKLDIGKILYMNYQWCCSVHSKFIRHDTGVSKPTQIDWNNFCREVCVYHCAKTECKLGGVGKVVEIDEAKFGKRKYERGRIIKGQWVIGGVERETKKLFLVPVEKRDQGTLINIILERVEKGTTIITDCWSGYKNLSDFGYTHQTVNHSQNFVDPQSGAYTQNIERQWVEVRRTLPRVGRVPEHFVGYLAEHLFKKCYPDFGERYHQFLLAISSLYTPLD